LVNLSIQSLAAHLAADATTDEARAWVMFAWVCNNISYDVDGFQGRAPRKKCDAASVLKARVCVCEGYARIYESLCKEVGLKVEVIGGKARSGSNAIGAALTAADGHAWNAVKLQGKWRLVDCTWGAGTCSDTKFTAAFRPHYFCIDPRALAFSHLPDDASWQLLPQALSPQSFVAQPHVWTADFFGHGLEFTPEEAPEGTIALRDGNQGSVKLKVPRDVELLAQIDDVEERCFQSRAGNMMTIHFRVQRQQQILTVYARRRGSSGSYAAVCKFSIVGVVGSKGCVEPWFPKLWQDPFAQSGIEFVEELPTGLLRPDSTRRVSVKLKVPETTKVMANLKTNSPGQVAHKIDASCRKLESGVVEIACEQVAKKFIGELVVYATAASASSSYPAVLSFRVEG
jgi:hypothetical protein